MERLVSIKAHWRIHSE